MHVKGLRPIHRLSRRPESHISGILGDDGLQCCGKALFGVHSSCSRLLLELRKMLQEHIIRLAAFFTPQNFPVTQIISYKLEC